MKDDVVHRRAALHASLPIFARRVEIGQPGCIGRPACFLRDVDGSSELPSHSWVRDLAERGLSKARSNNAIVTKAAFQSDPMKEGVRMIRTHLEDIVAWAQTRQTNRFLEAINGLLQAANSRARSFIRIETIKTVIFLIAGNLNSTSSTQGDQIVALYLQKNVALLLQVRQPNWSISFWPLATSLLYWTRWRIYESIIYSSPKVNRHG